MMAISRTSPCTTIAPGQRPAKDCGKGGRRILIGVTVQRRDQSQGIRPPVAWPDPRILQDFPYDFDLTTHTVFAGLMGSISHGTYVPREDPDSIDDVDIMAIVVPSPKWLLGLNQWEHWVRQRTSAAALVESRN